jgi:diguanylate cyclase (GGDEF)-like protein/PAS domain S-box-containing protein
MPRRGDTSGFRRILAGLIGRSPGREDPDAPGDALFKAFASSSPAAVFLHRGGRLLYANRGAATVVGRETRDLQGADYFALVHPDFRDGLRQRDEARTPEAPANRQEVLFLAQDGSERWVDLASATVALGPGHAVLAVGFDVSDRKLAESAHREAERRMRDILENVQLLAVIRDGRGEVTFANDFFLELVGAPAEEVIGRNWFDAFVPPAAQDEQRAAYAKSFQAGVALPYEESEIVARLEERRLVSWNHTVLHDYQGAVVGMASIGADITERKRVEQQLIHDAFHDNLTGLPNRALLMDRVSGALARARRRAGLVAVLFLDVDRFKLVNDSLGHVLGDQLLVQMSRLLATAVRPGDTVARLGGDEFIVLLEDVEEPADAVRVAERIHQALAAPFRIGGHEVFITASIGIAVSTREYQRAGDLVRDADTAMYQAKATGKACHRVFDTSMHARAVAALALENELRRAVERKSFVLHYQPVVQLSGGRIRGLEALVRWEHSQRGLVPPSEFIPMAEETGLISAIGRWALHESCRVLKDWITETGLDLDVAVNLSSRQFSRPDLVQDVAAALRETGLPPRCLKLEITESVIMENAEAAIEMLQALRGLGVGLSIDDFGTGYSSLAYLLRFPANTLKVDRSFIAMVGKGGRSERIVGSIVALGRSLEMEVVAEGVETAEQRDALLSLGCDLGQGYLFSRPVDAARVGQLLAGESGRSAIRTPSGA